MVTFNNKNFSLPNKNLTHEILSPQKFLRIQYVYFTCIRKVRIETILGLPCTNLGSKLCATILRLSIQSPTHYFLCGTCTLIGRRHIVVFEQRTKSLSHRQRQLEQIFNMGVGLPQIYVQKCTIC